MLWSEAWSGDNNIHKSFTANKQITLELLEYILSSKAYFHLGVNELLDGTEIYAKFYKAGIGYRTSVPEPKFGQEIELSATTALVMWSWENEKHMYHVINRSEASGRRWNEQDRFPEAYSM